MFAVFKTGGKQYKVVKDQILEIEKLETNAGELIQFNQILILSSDKTYIGDPLVSNAAVNAEVLKQKKDKKVISFIKRRRKHSSKRTKGHRQNKTVIKITEILENSPEVSKFDRKLNDNIFVLKRVNKVLSNTNTSSDMKKSTQKNISVDKKILTYENKVSSDTLSAVKKSKKPVLKKTTKSKSTEKTDISNKNKTLVKKTVAKKEKTKKDK